MNKTVIDIETVAQPIAAFDGRFHASLRRWFDPGPSGPETDEARRVEAERRLSLWGATGKVIVVGMHNPDTGKSRVLASDDEVGLLREFWELVKSFDLHITFNGKQFDFPFLQMRTAVLGLRPSIHLETRRYTRKPHYDLREVLTCNYLQRHGSLDFFCEVFGIPTPKQTLSGEQVGPAYEDGRLDDIAAYCEADIVATAALYDKVNGIL